ncbi:hypothetical protein CLV63_10952 [Murinocardiopsis flavida]|uniref:DNA-directed RNA polymerase specialized sigma24 family protein n=1 Tax=Murinocardiopsis flavida TaxID=645275 RepID=A0A2P8DIR7_9ACTN|nr:hypothetical protein CLV63_10952 [Murinocardiopsis flavida]
MNSEYSVSDAPTSLEDAPLRHGYTARALARLANYAATQYRYPTPLPWEERRDAAWSAIAEHLYTATEPPAYWDLIRAGWNAIAVHTRKHRSTHGQTQHGSAPQFHRYWMLAAAPAGSPEERVVERLALDQIWAALSPRNQDLIRALYDHGDYAAAAESLGLPVSSFYSLISRARRAFTALWLEGETPTRAWGNDVRTGRDRPKYVTTTARQRTRKRTHRTQGSGSGTPGTPSPGRAPRNRRDIGTTDTELVARYDSGESYREIAATLPIGATAVRTRILNART